MTKTPFDFQPGIRKIDSPYATTGRWLDCDKVRFTGGLPEKHKGYVRFAGPVTGIVRAMKAWDDFSANRHLVVGTHSKLQHISPDAVISDITPFREISSGVTSGTVTDPFHTVAGSPIVEVAILDHGATVGDTVIFSNANPVGGITINGPYIVTTVVSASLFTITHTANATSTVLAGGGLVTYQFEINIGTTNSSQGTGFGVGPYGMETYGTPRAVSSFTQFSRTWSLDLYGENLLAMPSNGGLYEWDPDTPSQRALLVENSPTGQFVFVTNERYPIVLGASGSLMNMSWPDQNDITNWTPGTQSTALTRTLKDGSRLVAGAVLINTLSLVWSDTSVYSIQYTGARNIIYTSNKSAGQCGLIGPHAFVIVGGRAYWMSAFSFFMHAGGVVHIPRAEDVEGWVFKHVSKFQNWKCFAHYSSSFNEVTWFYVPDGSEEPSAYVAVGLDDYSWTVGTYDRTAMEEQGGINPQIFGASVEGIIYQHDRGVDAAGAPLPWHLEAAPLDIEDGNSLMDVFGYVPNWEHQKQPVNLTLKTYEYSEHANPETEKILETTIKLIPPGEGMVDLHTAGRLVAFRLSGNTLGSDFRLGRAQFDLQAGGGRR